MSRRSSADLALVGVHVTTLDPARPTADAIACRDGIVIEVGAETAVRDQCDARTTIIHGQGATVVPGLVDAHLHPFWTEIVEGADLTRCATLVDLREALSVERARVGDDGWVRGWGLDYGVFRGVEIDGHLFADVVQGAPAVVTFMDQHTAVVTPAALDAAGVRGPVEFSEAAQVVIRDGRPTGELREFAAISLVRKVMPHLSGNERYRMIVDLLQRLNAVGLTGAHVMDGSPETFDLLRELEANNQLTLRVVVPFWQKPDTPVEEMERQLRLRQTHGRLWRGGVAKFFIDGVIDTGTGWLYQPDELGDGTVPFWPDPDRYERAVRLFAEAGFQCATHATGDRGVRAALDAYRKAGAAPGITHRIEHIETLQDDDLPRFAAEGVSASMQPLHMQWRQADGSDSWTARLGPDRAARAFRTRDLIASRALVVLGSDWPVAQYDPRIGMAWARLRRKPGDRSAPQFEPDQALSSTEVVIGYTASPAKLVHDDAVAGRIKVGYRADLTAFAENIHDTPADDLPEVPVTLTVVDGRIVHGR